MLLLLLCMQSGRGPSIVWALFCLNASAVGGAASLTGLEPPLQALFPGRALRMDPCQLALNLNLTLLFALPGMQTLLTFPLFSDAFIFSLAVQLVS